MQNEYASNSIFLGDSWMIHTILKCLQGQLAGGTTVVTLESRSMPLAKSAMEETTPSIKRQRSSPATYDGKRTCGVPDKNEVYRSKEPQHLISCK